MENKNNPYALLLSEEKKSKKPFVFKILNRVKIFLRNLTSRYADSDSEFTETTLFQLLNILENQIPCEVYFLTSTQPSAKAENFLKVFKNQSAAVKNALTFNFEKLSKKIKEIHPEDLKQLSPACPVILICENEEISKKWALKLIKKWKNVFYLKGGLTAAFKE